MSKPKTPAPKKPAPKKGHACCSGPLPSRLQDLAERDYPQIKSGNATTDAVHIYGRILNLGEIFDAEDASVEAAALANGVPKPPMPRPAAAPPDPRPTTDPDSTNWLKQKQSFDAWTAWDKAISDLKAARIQAAKDIAADGHAHWAFAIEDGTPVHDGNGHKRGTGGSSAMFRPVAAKPPEPAKLQPVAATLLHLTDPPTDPADSVPIQIPVYTETWTATVGTKKVAKQAAYVCIHAGNSKTLPINGKPTPCVFAFDVKIAPGSSRFASGWIPLDAIHFKTENDKKKMQHTLSLCSDCVKLYGDASTKFTKEPRTGSKFKFRSDGEVYDEIKRLQKEIKAHNDLDKFANAYVKALGEYATPPAGTTKPASEYAKAVESALESFAKLKPEAGNRFARYFRESPTEKGRLDKLKTRAAALAKNYKSVVTALQKAEAVAATDPTRQTQIDSAKKTLTQATVNAFTSSLKTFEVKKPPLPPAPPPPAPPPVQEATVWAIGPTRRVLLQSWLVNHKLGEAFGLLAAGGGGARLTHYIPKFDAGSPADGVPAKSYCNLSENLSSKLNGGPNATKGAQIAVDVFPQDHPFHRLNFTGPGASASPKGLWKDLYGEAGSHAQPSPFLGQMIWYYGYCDVTAPGLSAAQKKEARRYGWVPSLAVKGP